MSTYSDVSKKMNSGISDVDNSVSNIKKVSFEGVWSGSAYDNLSGALESTISRADKERTNLDTFSQAMEKLQKYKEKNIPYKLMGTGIVLSGIFVALL